uniref:ATP synthase complex subunit 8 n=1 Tax=Globospongicola spinulatus TaxID=1873859 RepID=A0A3Q8ADH4_9EUCA|nr:ATP synthase F0 subunit 8 [Globospongicola spinulatus]
MPQMAPMLWFYLFIFFILTYIIFMILNFFSKLSNPIFFNEKKSPVLTLFLKW